VVSEKRGSGDTANVKLSKNGKRIGRPRGSGVNQIIADRICDAIATHAKGLGAIIEELNLDMSPSLFYKWLQQDEGLRERYARARADQAQVMADEIASIADTTELGEIVTERPVIVDGTPVRDEAGNLVLTLERKLADMIEHRKLRIEARKWLAAKLLPKVYGDKFQVGGDGGGPIQFTVKSILDETPSLPAKPAEKLSLPAPETA